MDDWSDREREREKCLNEGLIREPRVQMDFVMWPLMVKARLPAFN